MIRAFTRECSGRIKAEHPKENNKANEQPDMEVKANMEAPQRVSRPLFYGHFGRVVK